jgi:hypothetical protein
VAAKFIIHLHHRLAVGPWNPHGRTIHRTNEQTSSSSQGQRRKQRKGGRGGTETVAVIMTRHDWPAATDPYFAANRQPAHRDIWWLHRNACLETCQFLLSMERSVSTGCCLFVVPCCSPEPASESADNTSAIGGSELRIVKL